MTAEPACPGSPEASSPVPSGAAAPAPAEPFVRVEGVAFYRGSRAVFDSLDMTMARGEITAVMGPSGTGKTTLLKLVSGELRPHGGRVLVGGRDVHRLSRSDLYALRKRMGVLFQAGALFTDLDVYDNVAFPLRELARLSEDLIRDVVLLKLEAVGLRNARHLRPRELSGGMARRVALARAIALDPHLVLYDEPLSGQDPISAGVLAALIRQLNDALGLTSIVVTHDVEQISAIADRVHVLSEGRCIASGTPAEIHASAEPPIRQFMHGLPDGPVAFHFPGSALAEDLFGSGTRRHGPAAAGTVPEPGPSDGRPRMDLVEAFAWIGRQSLVRLAALGRGAIFLARVLVGVPGAAARGRDLVRQVGRAGAQSMVLIVVAGAFVGMVLGLQGYNMLVRFGAEESLGLVVALALVRELGPVVSALLFAGRAGSALAAETGLMKTTEQLAAMGLMAVDPLHRIVAPRFLAGVFSVPLLAAVFSAVGVLGGQLVGVGLLGVDDGAFWSQMQAGIDFRDDVAEGIVKSVVFGVAVTWISLFQGYDSVPTAEGLSQATTRAVVWSSLAVLGLDFLLTSLMLNG